MSVPNQVLQALERRPMTKAQIERVVGKRCSSAITRLLKRGEIHVPRWESGLGGWGRVYKRGPGLNAAKPTRPGTGTVVVQVERMLEDGPMPTARILSAFAGRSEEAVNWAIRAAIKDGRIHVCGWVRVNDKGSPQRILKAGPGENVPRPKAGESVACVEIEVEPRNAVPPREPFPFRPMRVRPHPRADEIAAHPRMWTPRTVMASGFQLQGGFD